MKKRLLTLLIIAATFIGCNVTQEFSGAYNMLNCEYNYKSLTGFSVAGVDVSKGVALTDIPKVTSIFATNASTIPLDFTVNVDVTNPHRTAALLNGLEYILSVDGIRFTKGTVNSPITIKAGETQTIPLTMNTDLAILVKGKSKDAVLDIVKNLTGISSKQSQITVQLKPTFMVNKTPIASPTYIPISFSFGGKR